MRILVIQVIATILLIIGLCSTSTSGKPLPAEEDETKEDEEPVSSSPHFENVDNVLSKRKDDSEEDEEPNEENLPILPPIILLDFANDTNEGNVTSEEKSKRTVDSGLGYGFDKNNLQPRRYNYYFPAGKSGTTVSIEESVSPFLPKTIIERVQPSNHQGYFATRQNSFDTNAPSQSQGNYQYLNLHQTRKSQFGLRTKPQQATASSTFEPYQDYMTTARPLVTSFAIQNSRYRNNGVSTTTQSPLAFSATQSVRYVTPSPKFANPQSDSFNYAGRTYTGQRQNIQSNINSHGFGPVSQSVESSTVSPLSYNPHFPNTGSQNRPRYTLENGVRYENKVFWKYPDGRVSDVPPATYVEYPQSAGQDPKSEGSHSIYESSTTENSILSQGPVQFPTVSEQTRQEPNPFVSSESLSSSLPQQQVYRLGYQNLVTQRQNVNLAQQRKPSSNSATSYTSSSSSPSSSSSSSSGRRRPNYETRYQQISSRYMANSPNPEYTNSYTTEPTINDTTAFNDLRTSSNYYSTKAPSYLDTILGEDEGAKQSLSSYSNLQYSDLLNYNPSISEYIRNPSSILNVRPTFVQTGNSLIPVIILRVDGASPIQSKASQNINLKALLQQYLIQYAKSIQELAEPSSYNFGTESLSKGQDSGTTKSPVLDLIRLTQEDARETPGYASDSYVGRSSYETSNLNDQDFGNNRYVHGSVGRQKVKNVQILDDPRYTNYKAKN